MESSFTLLLVMHVPIGHRLSFASLKNCTPKGMPMIVKQNNTPSKKLWIASQMPANISHIILPIYPRLPLPTSCFPVILYREMLVFPKGKKANLPIVNAAFAQGMVMMNMHINGII